MEPSVHRFVLKHSPRETAILVAVTLGSLPFYYLSLDIPKNIFNQAILGRGVTFPTEVAGVSFDQIGYLFLLCAFFLLMVLVNGGIKQYINTYKGRLGERLLRRLRYELISRILRFPLPHFRKVSSGEIIPMITAEVEPLGGYFGDAFAQPLIQAGTLLTIVTFLFVQNPIMGLAAISLYPIQGYIIPKLQRRVNQLGKERVRAVRKLSERIGETVAGIGEVHAHGTATWERADFSDRLGLIYRIRFEIYQRKSFVKFLNNFLNQMAPLMFYAIGGYLVIHGDLTAGALAAALTAHKDMSSPWKELLDYYQQTQDAKIKYEQVIDQFRPQNMLDDALQAPTAQAPRPLAGPIRVTGLALTDDGAARVLDAVNVDIPARQKVAIVGPPAEGKEAMALLLARLLPPSAGKITIDGVDLATINEAVLGARIGYVGQSAYLFSASVRENLLYGLRHRPIAPAAREGSSERQRQRWLAESGRAGNLTLDAEADWIDPEEAGAKDERELTLRLIEALGHVDLVEDVYHLGLRGTLDPGRQQAQAAAILGARRALAERLAGDGELRPLVEPFHPERYNTNATLAENLLFGTPTQPSFEADHLADNPHVLAVLDRVGLTAELITAGRSVAETMVELFADLPPGHEFFEQFSFISSDDLPGFQALIARTGSDIARIPADDRRRLMALPFKLIDARHRLGLLDDRLKGRVLEARRALRDGLPEAARSGIAFFDPVEYNAAATLQDNILFGKIAYGQARAVARVGALIAEVLERLGLRQQVIDVGLAFQVGVGGARLTAIQRQKLAIARALVKHPDILILSEATALLDATSHARVLDGILAAGASATILWVLHNPSLARHFDRVLVFAEGRLVENGPYAELEGNGSTFARLLQAA